MSYLLKYTQTFEKQIEKIKKKDKTLMEEAAKKVEKLQEMIDNLWRGKGK